MKLIKLILSVLLLSVITNAYSQRIKIPNGKIFDTYDNSEGNKTPLFHGKSIGNNGKFTSYYPDGKSIESKGNYINLDKTKEGVEYQSHNLVSIRVGVWEFYDRSGKLTAKGNYANNLKTGTWEEYTLGWDLKVKCQESFAEGEKIKSTGYYSNNSKTGEWISTYEDGKIFSKCNYGNQGSQLGEQIYYYRNGNIMSKSTYNDKGKNIEYKEYDKNGTLIDKN
jgi:antitoxin component YwqK of YwqJK toxin-antitoxin module